MNVTPNAALTPSFLLTVKGITIYIEQRTDKIEQLLRKPPAADSMAYFHKLRVEIKKWNAFLRLIEFCDPGFDRKKIHKPFRKIFRQAGKIRELQISEALLKKYFPKTGFTAYRQYLRETRKKQHRIFRDMIDDTLFAQQKKALKKARPFLEKAGKKQAGAYLKKKWKSIVKRLDEKPVPPECLHDLRKRLKTYDYIRKGLRLHTPDTNTDESFLELLGHWHDLETTLARLQKVTDMEGISPEEMTRLKAVNSKLSAERDLAYKTIQKVRTSF